MEEIEMRLGRCPLSRAVAMALGLTGAGAALAQTSTGNELEEVVVTATRRSENLQNVPIALTALTNTTLSELNVQTLDDFLKYLPNVSTAGVAPGQDEIYMRGLATTHQGSQVVGGTGAFPNVAVYLDDQSAQLPGETSTSTRPTSRGSRCWKVRREPCMAPARKPARCATSPISRNSMSTKGRSMRATRPPPMAIPVPQGSP